MQEGIRSRLESLRKELETGQTELQQLQARETYLRETLLRISGAIQVLEELHAEEEPDGQSGTARMEARSATASACEVEV